MQITIQEHTYDLKFGIKFIREMDKKHSLVRDGITFGAALEITVPMLWACHTVALSDVIYHATCTEKRRPKPEEVDRFVEEHENIESLFQEVIEALKKANATKLKIKNLERELKK